MQLEKLLYGENVSRYKGYYKWSAFVLVRSNSSTKIGALRSETENDIYCWWWWWVLWPLHPHLCLRSCLGFRSRLLLSWGSSIRPAGRIVQDKSCVQKTGENNWSRKNHSISVLQLSPESRCSSVRISLERDDDTTYVHHCTFDSYSILCSVV